MKFCVLIIFLVLPWISRIGDWALRWTEGNERLQIVFVMMLFPLIMNGMQYYIIDSFIKKKETDHERLPTEDSDDERDSFNNALVDSDDDDDVVSSNASSEDVRMSRSKTLKSKAVKGLKNEEAEYDPDLDGQTVVGSSRSQQERGRLLPKELIPPE